MSFRSMFSLFSEKEMFLAHLSCKQSCVSCNCSNFFAIVYSYKNDWDYNSRSRFIYRRVN